MQKEIGPTRFRHLIEARVIVPEYVEVEILQDSVVAKYSGPLDTYITYFHAKSEEQARMMLGIVDREIGTNDVFTSLEPVQEDSEIKVSICPGVHSMFRDEIANLKR